MEKIFDAISNHLKAIFYFCSIILIITAAYAWGVYSMRHELFPYTVINRVEQVIFPDVEIRKTTLFDKLENDLGLKPSRYTYEDTAGGVPSDMVPVIHESIFRETRQAPRAFVTGDFVSDYVFLIFGVFEFKDDRFGSVLFDPAENKIVRHWVVEPGTVKGSPGKGGFVPDQGYLVHNFDSDKLVMTDFCGNEIKRTSTYAHHSIEPSNDGAIWHFDGISAVKRDVETFEISEQFSFLDLMKANPDNTVLHIKLKQTGWHLDDFGNLREAPKQSVELADGSEIAHDDPFHANDIEPVGVNFADIYPGEHVGLSLRALNAVFIVNVDTLKIVDMLVGRTSRQHDIDFNDDNTITIFDNNSHIGTVRIIEWLPKSGETRTVFDGTVVNQVNEAHGNHVKMDADTYLMTDFKGRVYVYRQGAIDLMFENRFSDSHLLEIRNAWAIPRSAWVEYEKHCT